MPAPHTVVCADDRAREIERLAQEHDVTEVEVLRQLVDIELTELDGKRPV